MNLTVNGTKVGEGDAVFKGHRINLPTTLLKLGVNVVHVDFEAEYVTDCQGMQWFKDEEDKNEYLYTNSEPDHAHLWFPCFDQPDIKAPYNLLVLAPVSWVVVSTANGVKLDVGSSEMAFQNFNVTKQMKSSFGATPYHVFEFDKSAPISTYLYCVCAGPYHQFDPSAKNTDKKVPMKIYCRQSIKKYVEEIAEDWFRVTKHGILYYEKMFSTPYPFDKLD